MDAEDRPRPDPTKGLWDIKETAAYLTLKVSAVRALLSSGQLTHLRVGVSGGRIRIRPSDVDAYLQACTRTGKLVARKTAAKEPPAEGIDHYAELHRRRG